MQLHASLWGRSGAPDRSRLSRPQRNSPGRGLGHHQCHQIFEVGVHCLHQRPGRGGQEPDPERQDQEQALRGGGSDELHGSRSRENSPSHCGPHFRRRCQGREKQLKLTLKDLYKWIQLINEQNMGLSEPWKCSADIKKDLELAATCVIECQDNLKAVKALTK